MRLALAKLSNKTEIQGKEDQEDDNRSSGGRIIAGSKQYDKRQDCCGFHFRNWNENNKFTSEDMIEQKRNNEEGF